MNFDDSITLINDTTSILESEAFSFLANLYNAIYGYKTEIERALLQDPNYSITGPSYTKTITNHINTAIANTSSFEISRLILQVEAKLDAQIEHVPENLATQIRSYIAAIVKFIKGVEVYKFAGAKNIQEMYESIINVNTQKSNLESYRAGIELLKTYVLNQSQVTEGHSIIDLAFYSAESSFQAFAQLASMIDFVYSEIGQILNKPHKSNALQIRMIYSGSIHFSLVGESDTLAFLETILKNSGKYFYENYTQSGQFQKLTGNMDQLIEKLQLLTILEAKGINVSEAKAQLEKSLTLIAKAISENLQHQYKMSINSSEILIAPIDSKSIPKYEPKLLPYRGIDETA